MGSDLSYQLHDAKLCLSPLNLQRLKTSKNKHGVTAEIFHLLPVLLAVQGLYPVLKRARLQEKKKK